MSRGMFFQWGAMRRVRTVCAGEMPRQRFFLNLERLSVGGEITNALKMPRLRAFGTVFLMSSGLPVGAWHLLKPRLKKGTGRGALLTCSGKGCCWLSTSLAARIWTAPLALVEKAGKNDKRKRTKCTHT